jgi:hypothetical protein
VKPIEPEFVPASVPGRWHWAVAALLLASAGAAAIHAIQHHKALEQARAELAAQQNHAGAPAPAPPPKAPAYERNAQDMLRERSHLWPQALTALENVAMEGVRVKGIDLQSGGQGLQVTVWAQDHPKLLTYLEALNAGQTQGRDAVAWSIEQTQVEAVGAGAGVQGTLQARRPVPEPGR